MTSRLVNNAYFYDTYIEMVPRKSTCHVIDVVGAKTRWPKSQISQMKNIVIVETLRGHFHIVEINIHCFKTEHLKTLREIQ